MIEISEEVKRDLHRLLQSEEGFIGMVYKAKKEGQSVQQIATEAGHKNARNVITFNNAIRMLFAVEDIYNPKLWDSRKHALIRIRTWLKSADLSEDSKNYFKQISSSFDFNGNFIRAIPIDSNEEVAKKDYIDDNGPQIHCNPSVLNPPQASPSLIKTDLNFIASEAVSTIAPKRAILQPGVYVYSYPLYLKNPLGGDGKTTLYKIGASGTNIDSRIERQARQTPVPDDIVTVRKYYTDNAFVFEKKFHTVMKTAGFQHKTNTGGVEWFMTTLEFIDCIADLLGLSPERDS